MALFQVFTQAMAPLAEHIRVREFESLIDERTRGFVGRAFVWRMMQSADCERFERYYEPVICFLATVREPVTIGQLQGWTNLSSLRIREVIATWRAFLNEDRTPQGESVYRLYHTSFQDFLREEVGLIPYHSRIAQHALDKIQW